MIRFQFKQFLYKLWFMGLQEKTSLDVTIENVAVNFIRREKVTKVSLSTHP